MSLHGNLTLGENHVLQNYEYADAAAREELSGVGSQETFVSTDIGKVALQTDDTTFWVLRTITPTWADITVAVTSDFTAVSTNAVPVNSGAEIFVDSGATVDPTSLEMTFGSSINVPAGSVNVGQTMSISEGGGDLVVADLINDTMAFSVNADFNDATGSSVPDTFDFGSVQTLNLQLIDTETLTANPLTFQFTVAITPTTDFRLTQKVIIRTGSALTNFRAKLTDNATGLVTRYIPSEAAFNGILPGLDLAAGDNTFVLTQRGTDTSDTFFLGFVPFVNVNGQVLDVEFVADSMDLLGDTLGFPYLVSEVNEGPEVELLTTASGAVFTTDTLTSQFLVVGSDGASVEAATPDDVSGIFTSDAFEHLDIRAATNDSPSFRHLDSSGAIRSFFRYDDSTDAAELISNTTLDITSSGDMTFLGGVGAAIAIDSGLGADIDITSAAALTLNTTAGSMVLTAADLLTIQSTADDVELRTVRTVTFQDGSTQAAGAAANLDRGRVSTARLKQTFDVSPQDGVPNGLYFRADGLKFYMAGNGGDNIYEYDLSVAWDSSTAVFNQSFDVSSENTIPSGVAFHPNGLTMYVLGVAIADGRELYQYTLSTAWDISTAVFLQAFDVSAQDTQPFDVIFSPNGFSFFIGGLVNDTVFSYDMTTAWDISTASSALAFTPTEPGDLVGMCIRCDGLLLHILSDADDSVYEYILTTPWDITTAEFVESLSVAGDGLVRIRSCYVSPYQHKMYFLGQTTDLLYEYDVGIETSLVEANVVNAAVRVDAENIEVRSAVAFSDASTQAFGATANLDRGRLATLQEVQTFSVLSEDTLPHGLYFKPDGLTFYLIGNTNDSVYRYDMTSPWDVSTSSLVSTFSVASETTNPVGIEFRLDGLRMYISSGTPTDAVFQYDLTTAWDITTATVDTSFDVSSETTIPFDLAFNPSGLAFYIVDLFLDRILRYDLSVAWDVSTAVFNTTTFTPVSTAGPLSLCFRADGAIMYVGSDVDLAIQEYVLTVPWDISTSILSATKAIDPAITQMRGLFVSPYAHKMYYTDQTTDLVYENDLGISTSSLVTDTAEIAAATFSSGVTFPDASTQANAAVPTLYRGRIATLAQVQTFSVLSEESVPQGLCFKPDGLSFFIGGNSNDRIWQYDLTTPWDISTAGFSKQLIVSSQTTNPTGVEFKLDGTVMFVASASTPIGVHQYNLSTPWDISTGVFDVSFDTTTEAASFDIAFNPDGLSFYMVDTSADRVVRYDCSTAWDIATASFNSVTFTPSEPTDIQGLAFRSDGVILYLLSTTDNSVSEYLLPTPWGITTADFVEAQGLGSANWRGVCVSPYAHKLYFVNQDDDSVYENDLGLRIPSLAFPVEVTGGTANIDFINAAGTNELNIEYAEGSGGQLKFEGDAAIVFDNTAGVSAEIRNSTASSDDADAILFLANNGTNPGTTGILAGDRSPDGLVTTLNSTIYVEDISTPKIHFNRSSGTTGNVWGEFDFVGETVVPVSTAANIDDLATAGEITIATGENLTLDQKTDFVSTATEFVLEGTAELRARSANADAVYLYSGTSAFAAGSGFRVSLENMVLVSTSTGAFFNLTNSGLNISLSAIIGFDDLGSMSGGNNFVIHLSDFQDCDSGFTLDNMDAIAVSNVSLELESMTGNFIDILPNTTDDSITIDRINGRVATADAVLGIDPAIFPGTVVSVQGCGITNGNLFDTAGGSIETFTAVADASVAATSTDAIDSVSTPGVTRFTFTVGPTLFVDQEVVISGFVTNTAYNGTFFTTTIGVGFFEVASIAFGTEEASVGSFLSNSITLTVTATTLNDGDTFVVDTAFATDYDGGATAYNQLTNSVQINRAYDPSGDDPQDGTTNTAKVGQKDSRVLAFNNPGFPDSEYVAYGNMNGNISTTSISSNAYGVVDLTGLTESGFSERFKLIDSVLGIWRYTGNEPLSSQDVLIIGWVIKSGSTEDYLFTTSKNGATPVFATAFGAPAEVKTTKVQFTLDIIESLVTGDDIQLNAAGVGTANDITITDVSFRMKR